MVIRPVWIRAIRHAISACLSIALLSVSRHRDVQPSWEAVAEVVTSAPQLRQAEGGGAQCWIVQGIGAAKFDVSTWDIRPGEVPDFGPKEVGRRRGIPCLPLMFVVVPEGSDEVGVVVFHRRFRPVSFIHGPTCMDSASLSCDAARCQMRSWEPGGL